jgi:hydroxymethylpyrimidine pyrophosphatase-like HAD family hydrolase
VSKGTALKKLKASFPGAQFHMVGDDPADLETLRWITHFFAVSNAQPEVRKRASYTSVHPYTRGVVEILRYFEKHILEPRPVTSAR